MVNEDWRSKTITIDGADLDSKRPEISFVDSDPTHLCRVVFATGSKAEKSRQVDEGVKVSRTFQLIDKEGKVIRTLESGDTVPRGSLIRSSLAAASDTPFNYTLAANPKPSVCRIFDNCYCRCCDGYALKEEKTGGIFWHHEMLNHTRLNNNVTYRIELAGEFLVPLPMSS